MAATAPTSTIVAVAANPAAAIFRPRGATDQTSPAIPSLLIRPRLNSGPRMPSANTSQRAGTNQTSPLPGHACGVVTGWEPSRGSSVREVGLVGKVPTLRPSLAVETFQSGQGQRVIGEGRKCLCQPNRDLRMVNIGRSRAA